MCVTLIIYQESLHDARSTKCKILGVLLYKQYMKVLNVREPESDIRINNSLDRRADDFKTIFSTGFVISSFFFLSAMGLKSENILPKSSERRCHRHYTSS